MISTLRALIRDSSATRNRSCIVALALTSALLSAGTALGETVAQQPPAAAGDGALQAHTSSMPNDAETVALLRNTLAKVDQGNKSGDYHALYAELTPQVQKVVDPPKLASALEGFRKLRVDMSPIANVAPLYERPPALTPDGVLLLRGTFPTRPREIRFDFGFTQVDHQWRIQALNLDTPGSPPPVAASPSAPIPMPASAPVPQVASAPAPLPRAMRKAADSPYLDTSTDPPTATKW